MQRRNMQRLDDESPERESARKEREEKSEEYEANSVKLENHAKLLLNQLTKLQLLRILDHAKYSYIEHERKRNKSTNDFVQGWLNVKSFCKEFNAASRLPDESTITDENALDVLEKILQDEQSGNSEKSLRGKIAAKFFGKDLDKLNRAEARFHIENLLKLIKEIKFEIVPVEDEEGWWEIKRLETVSSPGMSKAEEFEEKLEADGIYETPRKNKDKGKEKSKEKEVPPSYLADSPTILLHRPKTLTADKVKIRPSNQYGL